VEIYHQSTPNSRQDLYVDGELWQRRYYDGNGNMIKDIDFIHNNSGEMQHTFPHEHYWNNIGGKWERLDLLEWLEKLKGK